MTSSVINPITAEQKQKWIEALRSGSYEQGKSCLRNEEGNYCCLGVLADVTGTLGTTFNERQGYLFSSDSGQHNIHLLPRKSQRELYHLNDTDGLKFPAIADWIEQNIKVAE